ncbi:MAG: hypothetical protein R6V35_03535 [Candidatus Nanohaloarchaea archaeon]
MTKEAVERFVNSDWAEVEDYRPGDDFGIGEEYVTKFTANDFNYHKGVFSDYILGDLLIEPGENEFRVNDRNAKIYFEMGDRELAIYADQRADRMINQQQGVENFLEWYELPAAYQKTFDQFEK